MVVTSEPFKECKTQHRPLTHPIRYNTMSGRTRGYRFENDIARRYVRCGWRAWRLGASSNGLPDILAVGADRIHVHELKTTIRDTVRIPAHQIERCMDVAESFPKYTGRTILSARFGRKAEYHYLWDGEPVRVSINIRGRATEGATQITWNQLIDYNDKHR